MTAKEYRQAMIAWVKEIVRWQLANPDKDWLQEMGTADVEGGDRPPVPPVKP